jgi:copper(I)-binding protein
VLLTLGRDQAGGAGQGPVVTSLPIPARSVTTLTPFGSDVVLTGTRGLMAGQRIPVTLVFRRAGRVTVQVRITAPGSP